MNVQQARDFAKTKESEFEAALIAQHGAAAMKARPELRYDSKAHNDATRVAANAYHHACDVWRGACDDRRDNCEASA